MLENNLQQPYPAWSLKGLVLPVLKSIERLLLALNRALGAHKVGKTWRNVKETPTRFGGLTFHDPLPISV